MLHVVDHKHDLFATIEPTENLFWRLKNADE